MGNDPRKLVGVHLRGGKLSYLVQTISIASEHLYAKSVCPVGASVSRVCSNDIVSCVDRLFPDFKSGQSFCGFEHLGVLEHLTESVTVAVIQNLLAYLCCLCASAVREETGSCHHKRIVLSGWKLLVHQTLVLDTLSQLPSPPRHLSRVNLKAIHLLDVLDPLFLFTL